jgi:two-component system, cell cycle response regulator DivK
MKERRILLVEDNDQNAYLARFLLQQAGLEVSHVRNGKEGLRAAREEQWDLILLDIQLPDLDGYEIARTLRSDPSFTTPLVALTSFAMAGERKKALEIGCNGYIEKPISPLKFADEVRSYFK